MKEIEQLLQSAKETTPKRSLSTSFTDNVLDKINTPKEKAHPFMNFYKKPFGAALSVAVVLAGSVTTYAGVSNWPAIVSVFREEHSLVSGARVVKIETDGCQPVDGSSDASKRVSYYEIKKDSSLTNEQAVAMMRGVCEEERAQSRVGELVHRIGGAVSSSGISTIENINTHSMTVTADKNYDGSMRDKSPRDYVNIAPSVLVSDGISDIQYSSLQPGDSVVLVLVDERGISTEIQGYTEDLTKIQVRGILKVPPLTGSPDLFYKYLGKDFVRVEPSQDGKSFNRVYEFDDNIK